MQLASLQRLNLLDKDELSRFHYLTRRLIRWTAKIRAERLLIRNAETS